MHLYLSHWMIFWHKITSHWIDQHGSYIRIQIVNGLQKKLWMDWNLTCQLMEVSVQYQLTIKQQLSGRCTSEEYLKSITFLYRTDNLQWSKIYFLFKHGICQFSVSFIFVGISFHFLKKICFIIYKWPEKGCTNLNFQFLNYEICYFIDLTKINFLLHLSWVMMLHVKVYGLNYHFS